MNLELFPCSGGMAEGFRRAGVVFDVAIDKDPDACASYEANHGHRPVQMDVGQLVRMAERGFRPAPLLDAATWPEPGAFHLLVADPPCTPWSRAGKREGLDDERDMLAETVRLIELWRPRAYLIGNVPGLEDGPNLGAVQRTIGRLAGAGYCVVDFATLDAADFGVPQHRVRPFWYGHLDGPCIRWPAPTHGDPEQPALPGFELLPWVTCRDALGHLPIEELGKPVRMRKRACNGAQHGSVPERPALGVGTSNLSDGNVLLVNDRHGPARPAQPAPTLGAKQRSQGAQVLRLADHNRPPADPDHPHCTVSTARAQATLAWPWERPATTVTADERLPPPGHHPESGSILSVPDAVVLSERAAAILQGFSPGWVFHGKTKRSRWSQIGQAMPPALAEAVARAVVEARAKAEDASALREATP